MSDGRGGWVYTEPDGTVIYRVNTIGSCITSLVAARLGESATPPGEHMRKHFDNSASVEDDILKAVAAELRGPVIWQQKTVELKVPVVLGDKVETAASTPSGHAAGPSGTTVIVRGHIDGMQQLTDDIIEAKAFGDSLFQAWQEGGLDNLGTLGIKYRWQGAAYGHATGRPVRFCIGHKKVREDGTVYIDDLIIEPAISAEELVPLAEFEARIRSIEEYAYNDQIPDCDRKCRKGDAYAHVHMFEAPKRADDDLYELIQIDADLKARISELEDERKDLRNFVKATFAPGEYAAGDKKLHLTIVKERRFSSAKFRVAHPELYDEFREPNEYLRMVVIGKKKPKEATA